MTAFLIINLIFTVLSVIVLLKTRFEYRESASQYDLRYIKWKDGGRYRYSIFVWIGLIFLALIPILPIFLLAGVTGYILNNYYDSLTDLANFLKMNEDTFKDKRIPTIVQGISRSLKNNSLYFGRKFEYAYI